MGTITTAMCKSFKQEILSAGHCLLAPAAPTGDVTSGNQAIANVSSLVGLAIGMAIAGTGIAANSILDRFISSTSIHVSVAPSATNSGVTLTHTADPLKIALIKSSPTGTYNNATANYSDLTGNSDEVTGTGYTAGGVALTNVSPTLSSTTALFDISPDPSWTTATFTAAGALIYNTVNRLGTANRSISVHSFGGDQTVTAGTFTAVMPTPDASNAIIRIA